MTDSEQLIAGRYRLVNRIAVGGMGVVWEGWDELLARRVAVKQVLTQSGLSEADTLLARNRVIREARITARLHHPNAVTIYDVVDDGAYPCLIMQFVPSTSLNSVLREHGTLPPWQVGRIGADLAAALRAAHEVGIVHRDVKPGNVLITDDGSAKLTDFGISHAAGDVTLTSTGMVSGTPAYLAPEVARGATSGFSADVFSLGATMYAALEGTPPFGLDTNPMAVLHRVASGQLIPPKRSGPLTPLLLQMMAPDPTDRPTMSEVSRTLTTPAVIPPTARRPAGVGTTAERTLPVSRAELAAAGIGPEEPGTPEPGTAESRIAEPRTAGPPTPAPISGEPRTGEPQTAEPQTAEPVALAELMAPKAVRSADSADDPSRRRPAVRIAIGVVVLVAVLVAGFLLVNRGDGGQGSVAATAVQAGVGTSQSPETSSSPTDVKNSPTQEAGSQESAVTGAEAPPDSSAGTELATAVSDYYALMPGNTDAGWARLTPNFQSGIARDREYYNSFWAGVQRVAVSDVVGTAPGTVQATISYYFTDGSVSVERTEYQLVRDGGELKIDNSTVLSG